MMLQFYPLLSILLRIKILHVDHVWEKGEDKGIKVSFEVVLNYGSHIPTMIQGIQKKIKEVVEYMTGMFVHDVDIVVKGLKFK